MLQEVNQSIIEITTRYPHKLLLLPEKYKPESFVRESFVEQEAPPQKSEFLLSLRFNNLPACENFAKCFLLKIF